MINYYIYNVRAIEPYINWLYFYHAWGLSGKPITEREKLRTEAEAMLLELDSYYHTHAAFGLFEANSDGDDLLIGDVRIPLLRQQHPSKLGSPHLCLADFVRPLSSGVKDQVGIFATTVDLSMEKAYQEDVYKRMLVQTLADRLAEATAEKLHEDVRKHIWGYAPDENLPVEALLREDFQGIRPAIGYPSLPDVSVNFILSDLSGMDKSGIRLTENGMMQPHASVSGFMFAHPQARYFDIGKIGEDQLLDYARRRGMTLEVMRKFVQSSLIRK